MDPELAKNLKNCKVKKSLIESTLKLPKNSLSGMINGTRPTPKKTEEKLQTFINELLFETAAEAILNSTETPIPNGVIITGPIVDMVKNPLDLVSVPTQDTGPHRLKFPEPEPVKKHTRISSNSDKIIDNGNGTFSITDPELAKAFSESRLNAANSTVPKWHKLIEDYCGIAGITPEELIEQHAMKGAKKTMIEVPKEEKPKIQVQQKGDYNPKNHPKYIKLHGAQKEEKSPE